jgi:hypothetical protein
MITTDAVHALGGILALAVGATLACGCGTKGHESFVDSDASADDADPGGDDAPAGSDASPNEAAGGGDGGSGQQALWYKFLGDGANEDVGGVAVDHGGNVYYTGTFQGVVDFGGGPLTADGMSSDIYLAKYDPTGKFLWANRFGDTQVQQSAGLAVDAAGDAYITGANYGVLDFGGGVTLTATAGQEAPDIFVAKFDSTGKITWAKEYGDPGTQSGQSVAVDAQGNLAVTGSMQGTTDFGKGVLTSAGLDDIFLLKLDPAGNTLWAQRYGDPAEQFGWFVTFDATGDVVLGADFQGAVDVGKGPLTSAGMYDVLVAKLDPSGTAIFGERWGDSQNQLIDCVAVDGEGEILISGGFQGSIDFGKGAETATDEGAKYLTKLDGSGNTLWSKSFGDGDPFDWTSLAADPMGGVVIAGEFVNTIDFGQGPIQAKDKYDIFVAHFDTSGNDIWGYRYGAADDQYARSVALTASDGVIMGGYFLGKLGFGNGGGMMAPGNGLLYLVELSN